MTDSDRVSTAEDTPEDSTSITSPFGEPIDYDGRLSAAVAANLARRAARLDERARLADARRYGLSERHRTKLARNQGPTDTPQQPHRASGQTVAPPDSAAGQDNATGSPIR